MTPMSDPNETPMTPTLHYSWSTYNSLLQPWSAARPAVADLKRQGYECAAQPGGAIDGLQAGHLAHFALDILNETA